MTKPSEILMTKIIERLQKEQILTANEANKITGKVLAGKIKSEDWRLAVDLSLDKGDRNVEKDRS